MASGWSPVGLSADVSSNFFKAKELFYSEIDAFNLLNNGLKSIFGTLLYKNELFNPNDAKTFKFRVLIWGDYYDLTDADKEVYLTKSYNLEITAKVIQAKDQYGGTLDYEND